MDATVTKAGMFQGVDSAVAAVTKQLQPVDFARRWTVFAEGEPADRLYIIISGKVKIGRRSPEGREHLLAIMGPLEMFGELSIFDPGPRTASATTLTEVRAVSLDRDTLRGWMADRPEVAEQLLRVLARRLRRTNNKLTDQMFTDVPGRVAKQLLLLAQQFGTREGDALRGWSSCQRRATPFRLCRRWRTACSVGCGLGCFGVGSVRCFPLLVSRGRGH